MKACLAFVLAVGTSMPALACELACSDAPVVLPSEATESVPANAFRFEVVHDDHLELTMADRTSNAGIASSVRDGVWSADAALQPGHLVELRWRTSCSEGGALYTVGPDASIDRKASAALVAYTADAPHGQRRRYAALHFVPPTTAPGYLRQRIEVDGKLIDAASNYGSYAIGELDTTVWTICDAPQAEPWCDAYSSVTPDKHEVAFITWVLGKSESASKVSIDLRCDADADASAEVVEDESGCQLGAPGGGAWALLGLLLRRRRYGTSSPRAASTSARV